MPRLPKAVVNYKPMKVLEERCGLCKHFIPEYGDVDGDNDDATICIWVAGQIQHDYVCKLFEPIDLKEIMQQEEDEQEGKQPQSWQPPRQSTIAPMDMASLYPSAMSGSMQSSETYMSVNKERRFGIQKFDDAEQLVFGWASIIANADGSQIVDHHDDLIDSVDLEKAAYEYVLKFGDTGVMHSGETVGKLVESLVLTPEKCKAMGISTPMQTGWWVGYKLNDPAIFAKVKDGTYSMFSIQGTAVREEYTIDEVGKAKKGKKKLDNTPDPSTYDDGDADDDDD